MRDPAVMTCGRGNFVDNLNALIARLISPEAVLKRHRRLSGGASQETWQLDVEYQNQPTSIILRRAPGGGAAPRAHGSGLATEAELIRSVSTHGVPVPDVLYTLSEADNLGSGFVMAKVEGETIARKILRDSRFSATRPSLARRCGEILAAIHAVPLSECPPLWQGTAPARIHSLREQYLRMDELRPVFEVAFRWLQDRLPADPSPLKLVHGDFRNGNLIIDETGVAAVLDWELAHIGDPLEDLGWLCVPSWRFGEIDKVAGGFGTAQELLEGYESAGGGTVDRRTLKFWAVFGTLFWGVTCIGFAHDFLNGDRGVERAAIGRRTSEVEIDLLSLIEAGEEL